MRTLDCFNCGRNGHCQDQPKDGGAALDCGTWLRPLDWTAADEETVAGQTVPEVALDPEAGIRASISYAADAPSPEAQAAAKAQWELLKATKTAERAMVVANPDYLAPEQALHVDRAKTFESGFQASSRQGVVYAFLAGLELNWLKSNLKHGEWLKFKEAHLPQIPARSATRYMAFADQIGHTVADLPTMGNLKLLSDWKLAPEDEQKIVSAFHDNAGGKTLTELYRDTGVIRDKKPHEHHPIKPQTPDEKIAAEKADAAARRADFLNEVFLLETAMTSQQNNPLLDWTTPIEWKVILRATRRLGKLIVPFTKRKQGKSAKAPAIPQRT